MVPTAATPAGAGSRPLRVGLVGCGRLAELGYAPALASAASVALVSVADPVSARCTQVAPGLPAFRDAAAQLAADELDLLVIASPPAAHLADAARAAEAGVVSLVEKPPATDAEGARRLACLAPSPWVGFNRRFEPPMAELRERSLAARRPLDLELELSILPRAWGAYGKPTSALLDLGPHVVDLAGWLSGSAPNRVRTEHLDELGGVFELELEDGRARIDVSHARPWRESIVVRDARGRTVAHHARGGLGRRIVARAISRGRSPLVASLAAQLDALAQLIRGGRSDARLASAADAVRVMSVLDEVSAGEGEWRSLSSGEPAAC